MEKAVKYRSTEEQFREWIQEICRWNNVKDFVHLSEYTFSPFYMKVLIYTREHKYCIIAKEKNDGNSYLGCVVDARKPRAGETWTRGNDLPDGKFCRETWERIKDSIIRYELVKIAKPVRGFIEDEGQTVWPDKK